MTYRPWSTRQFIMSQQWALTAKTRHIQAILARVLLARWGKLSLSTSDTTSGILDLVLDSLVWEIYRQQRTTKIIVPRSTWCTNEGLRGMHSSNLKMRRLCGDLNATFAYLVEGYRWTRLPWGAWQVLKLLHLEVAGQEATNTSWDERNSNQTLPKHLTIRVVKLGQII